MRAERWKSGEEFEELIDGKLTRVVCGENKSVSETCENCIFFDKKDDSCFSKTVEGCAIKDKKTGKTVHFEEVKKC